MPINIDSAERFVHANARVVERHCLAVLLDGGPVDRVLDALRPYRNRDGGFGRGLEPDVRCPDSQPAAVLHAFEVLDRVGSLEARLVAGAADWLTTITGADGGVPTVLPSAMA